jgi:serine/threonine-protein kinase
VQFVNRVQSPLFDALQDRYEIQRELGRGGMATVYLAQDLRHQRPVALKVLTSGFAAAISAERFLREIRIAARLNHPHIVPLHDSGEAGGTLYYVMPFVEGESLHECLQREHQLPVDRALRIVRDVADGLAHAHGLGVVHRDIKPGNILLTGSHALLADFGIARAVSTGDRDMPLTETGLALGTTTYMSPEQATGVEDVDERSDIYSLACVLYEMLAGTPPFTGPTAHAVLARKLSEPIPKLTIVRETVSPRLERTVEHAMARSPVDRIPTARAFVEALDALARPAPGPPADTASTAVLPFVNMSADPENEFFSDGISEELINVLAQIPGLRVAARTSSFSFKGKNINVRALGEQLSVGTVVEGSVRRAGPRVRITAQLVNATDGYHLWSGTYDRELEDVFAIQDEIAGAIAAVLRVKLLGTAGAAQRHSPDASAYQHYLKGRHLWNQDNTNAGRALEWFRKAVERDPKYALPYAGMADCYCTIGAFQMAPQAPIREAGIAAARKALDLGDDIAESHFSSGYVRFYLQWDWAGAEREFHRALELNPNFEQPSLFLGVLLAALGRFDEAEVWAARGKAADPVSAFAQYIATVPTYFRHDWDRSIDGNLEALELNPALANPLWNLSVSLSYAGQHDRAIATGQQLVTVSQRAPVFMATLIPIYVRAKRLDEARAIEAELDARSESEYVTPYVFGLAKAWLGKVEEALRLLEVAYGERNTLLWALASDAGSNPLRSDPRFVDLVKRMRLR